MNARTRERISLAAATFAVVALCAATGVAQDAVTRLSSGFGTQTAEGPAGGSQRAVRHGVTDWGVCTGWIAQEPNHVVTLTDDFAQLRIAVQAPEDTTLVITGPGGVRCSDDGDGDNPVIEGEWEAGRYEIFVGSYARNAQVAYTIRFRD